MPLLPICARIDGRSFSSWTNGLARPFDAGLSMAMVETTKFLVEESHAKMGYTQSDEISLVFHGSSTFFDGKLQKLVSVLASLATAKFNALVPLLVKAKVGRLAAFDCRVWAVPNEAEATNVLLWREQDATKNSVSMAARAYYSHKELHGKSSSEMQELLFQKGVNWDEYPAFFKRGTFARRRLVMKEIEPETLARIPEGKRPASGTRFERSEIVALEMPPFTKVTNRVDVVFRGAEPILASELAAERVS